MVRNPVVLVLLSACAATLLTCEAAVAARIQTGANCSLVDAIASANTNVAVGGCAAGNPGRDTVVAIGATTLGTVNIGSNGLPVVVEDLVITSPDPAVVSFISRDFTLGTPEFRMLEIGTATAAPTVTLRRLRLQNGRVSGSLSLGGLPIAGAGGCIFLRNGSLTIADSVIEECTAVGIDNANGPAPGAWGGAIAATAGSLTVRNSSFSLNSATGGATLVAGQPGGNGEGGAIFASGLTSLVIEGTTISSNFATGGAGVSRAGIGRGGGLTFFGIEGTLTRSAFSANAASGGTASSGTSGEGVGGAIAVENAILTVSDSELTGNVANGASSSDLAGYASGGGLFGFASTLTLVETTVSNNRATGGSGSSAAFNGVARGGGLFLFDTTTTIDGVAIEANSITGANPLGGGIAVRHDSPAATPFLMTKSSVTANSASATLGSADGGGFYQDGDTVTIRNTGISDNTADRGGGLFQESGTTVVTLSTLSSNTAATLGGGVAVDGSFFVSNTVELANVTISGNTAGIEGGGFYVKAAPIAPDVTTVRLSNVTVASNDNGGFQLVHDRSDPVLEAGNSIIGAQASGSDCAVSSTAVITSNGGNLESGTSCAFTASSDRQSVADLGLSAIGSHGGETLTHDLLPGSPAIDAGRRRICNREASEKDQRGLARFYDGNGDRDFACDSGAVEAQGLLANPGFEEPLDVATDWSLVASGGGDGRVPAATAPSGRFVAVLQANGAFETLSQTVPVAGGSGESYTLTLLALGAGLTPGEAMDVVLLSKLAGTAVDSATCTFNFPSADFSGSPAACAITTTGAYDSLEASLAWDGVAAGTLTIDAVSLVRR